MRSIAVLLLFLSPALRAQQPLSATAIADSLRTLSLSPQEAYHVRDLRLSHGDFTIYLNEGVLAFAQPVGENYVAAIFTTASVEAGDAEVLISPPTRGERASLAYFAKTPNLDEHFSQAIFVFSDTTRADVIRHIQQHELPKTSIPDELKSDEWIPALRSLAIGVEVPLIESLLNGDAAKHGVFYAAIAGTRLGPFEVCYSPNDLETTVVGRLAPQRETSQFQVWTSFNPRRSPSPLPAPVATAGYKIDVSIAPGLKVAALTDFSLTPHRPGTRAIELEIAPQMKVTAATIDGHPAEVIQPSPSAGGASFEATRFLIVSPVPLQQNVSVPVRINHSGSVIRDEGEGVYFVEARNIWFPHLEIESATFDLTFRCPAKLRIVSSGKLVSDEVNGDTRVVHRVLDTPVQFIGFNLGDFVGVEKDAPPFHVEFYANRSTILRVAQPSPPAGAIPDPNQELNVMAGHAVDLLHFYSRKFGPPPTTNIAVTPIGGTFGQGFPGLIYLSVNAYLPPPLRPPAIRNTYLNAFYSDIMLAHEIAHQWWGNLVVTNDYRSAWLNEALANFAALDFYRSEKGPSAEATLLEFFKDEMESPASNGQPLETQGPLNVGLRLLTLSPNAWRVITYDKGTWVIRMLEQRIGPARFPELERALIEASKPNGLTNELFRKTAARFLPSGDPDRTLEDFFEAWVYDVGVPTLKLEKTGPGRYVLRQSGVPDDFSVDVPIHIESHGKASVRWTRTSKEGTTIENPDGAGVNASLPAPSDFLYLP